MIDDKGRVRPIEHRYRTREEAKDTGMAIVLMFLLLGQILHERIFLMAATVALILDMTWPQLYRHPSRVWLGWSHILGTIVSKLLLVIVFFLLVLPVGFARRFLGKDPMQLKKWKRTTGSVFRDRNHLFQPDELERPY